ncbi:2-succinyl-6-hydroxy-2,4-cyclohexadiene-1-carboxylate synthase [Ureibacillus acetophenoni]|uniref:Putative 2-succinyl-6-hydroxy-2,4-cyclohexadiene-1-carboxylate synthase n=1 Tax=Ureibacillus acetophenoni TaxID=614649 RepID=A0A285U4A6_9BACL|nr:2-succinyl-6-hydroxy-2,4-cyclohexadiene-1-carboxylate synthase [Ureibacillus acetophenoni]SOC36659.1 2-succinyl-6-hydroxy-2,4-cyclohexadiene-1-carboxylate synthase [Ureibacillus acetophenoni]
MMLSVRGLNYHVKIWNEQSTETIVLLHGFTGSVDTWSTIVTQLPNSIKIIAIDLIGHGKTDAPIVSSRYRMDEQIADLKAILDQLSLNAFTLLGYSMGGRVALSYVCAYPEGVKNLILESSSPGLKTEDERVARRLADDSLANKIEAKGIVSFVNAWENIPLFASQKNLSLDIQQSVRNERIAQREIGLANSLRGMGTGAQKSLWNELHSISIPVYLITGELDHKFYNIAGEMKTILQDAKHYHIDGVGHAIHVENPTQFATIIKDVYQNN